ncbi:CheR family methyltransferase [Aquirhabdus parva]|uniref:protein-glutamate O-methyltransferase n=1 Tax=Aquirhabdus parva TaxID=2283318 RepID=A0A345P7U7_9GAMM|nr:protein-glutamate O-methyltransferase CheR [Aquirhabdus parva]AXI03356.1 protein-glutamate O-methyltransferase CheR [Aquirhabdus parva]
MMTPALTNLSIQPSHAAGSAREKFDDEQYALWRSLIESRIGMVLPDIQRGLFELRVGDRMRICDLSSASYYQYVQTSAVEWQRLVEDLVVHETAFFRHLPSFELLEQRLPLFKGVVHIWSVGCATGEETWSLAMLAEAHVTQGYSVMASDISDAALATAQVGRYSWRKSERIPLLYRQFCVALPESTQASVAHLFALTRQDWQVSDVLREHVFFHRLNLMDSGQVPFRRLQVIFCQNVLIYFRQFDRRDILDALVQRLEIGGLLVLGPGEMADWDHPAMMRIKHAGTLAYERIK